MKYDVIVIGTGPAGLSAAITLSIRNKEVLLIGNSKVSNKIFSAHKIMNYPGIPDVSGEELAKRFSEHIEAMDISILNRKVNAVYGMDDCFNIQTDKNEILESSAVIIAAGVDFGKPYPGENEFLGRGVSYCATCDACFYKEKNVAVIGASKDEEEEALFLSEVCREVTYIPLYKEDIDNKLLDNEKIKLVTDTPVSISGAMKADTLTLMDSASKEYELKVDGIFILRDGISPSQLVPGIKMDNNHIEVNRRMETNIKGCFACGDITGAPYQYIKAAGEGNVAAISAVGYINKLKEQQGK